MAQQLLYINNIIISILHSAKTRAKFLDVNIFHALNWGHRCCILEVQLTQ